MPFRLLLPAALLLFGGAAFYSSCGTIAGAANNINFFSPEYDVELGAQVAAEIASKPQEYPLLPERGNEEVYSYIRGLTDLLLNTGEVEYRDMFAWQVKIIDDDETLNAFATPGGYIYVYTGLIKYLDTEDALLGVMGHEIAHAARRHSTKQLSKAYGAQILLSVVTGRSEPGMIEQIALGLTTLKFGREAETEADAYSVRYLCPTNYDADGAAEFFRKLEQAGGVRQPEFLSTHPNPGNRVQDIDALSNELNCGGNDGDTAKYRRIKGLL